MNFKHGFDSNQTHLNPDSRLLGSGKLVINDLVLVEKFLNGVNVGSDLIKAHQLTHEVYQAGRLKYRTLFPLAEKYVHSTECATLNKLIGL